MSEQEPQAQEQKAPVVEIKKTISSSLMLRTSIAARSAVGAYRDRSGDPTG
jgi:hypothetical protein